MYIIGVPGWVDRDLVNVEKLEEIDDQKINQINSRLKKILNKDPEATIVIPAWNEEVNIIKCIDSLSKSKTSHSFNILVVNNNSQDRTQEVLDKLEVDSVIQPVQGCGPARQLGQLSAKGKFILTSDADCIYPPTWVDTMIRNMMKPDTVCIYGRYSFLPNEKMSRFQFFLYERLRDIFGEIRHINRPYLNAYGMSMAYIRELGVKEGFVDQHIRGEDGRLCFDLMKYGKVRVVRSFKNRVWTPARTIYAEGSFWNFFKVRLFRALANFGTYFSKEKEHDTRTSPNTEYTIEESLTKIKKSLKSNKK